MICLTEVRASNESYVSFVEVVSDPTKVNLWPGPKQSLSNLTLKSLLSFFSRKTGPYKLPTIHHTLVTCCNHLRSSRSKASRVTNAQLNFSTQPHCAQGWNQLTSARSSSHNSSHSHQSKGFHYFHSNPTKGRLGALTRLSWCVWMWRSFNSAPQRDINEYIKLFPTN